MKLSVSPWYQERGFMERASLPIRLTSRFESWSHFFWRIGIPGGGGVDFGIGVARGSVPDGDGFWNGHSFVSAGRDAQELKTAKVPMTSLAIAREQCLGTSADRFRHRSGKTMSEVNETRYGVEERTAVGWTRV